MNCINKIVCSALMLVGLLVNPFLASDIHDDYGQPELIKFLNLQEKAVAQMQKEKARLHDICFESVKVRDGSVEYKIDDNGTKRSYNTYRTELRRRPSCLDSDVQAYKQCQQDVKGFISTNTESLKAIAEQSGVSLIEKDSAGYTVLNHCYTEEFYNELRRLGAPFQVVPWAYFNPVAATCTTVGVIAAVVAIYYYVIKKQCNRDSEDKVQDTEIK